MTGESIEFARFRLRAGISPAELVAASSAMQAGFLDKVPGFSRRELLHLGGRDYADLVHWESRAAAEAALKQARTSPEAGACFGLMDRGEVDPTTAVSHYAPVAAHGRDQGGAVQDIPVRRRCAPHRDAP